MTDDREQYEQYLEEFGTALRRASLKHHALRSPIRRPWLAGAVATVSAIVATVVLIAAPGGSTVNVVERASAALAVDGAQLVHYRVRLESGPAERTGTDIRITKRACPATGPIEIWQAARPLRWRMVSPPPCGPGVVDSHGRPVSGRVERSFANGVVSEYVPEYNTLDASARFPTESSASRIPLMAPGVLDGDEPLAAIRRMLEAGALRERGERVVDGRRVRILFASETVKLRHLSSSVSYDKVTVYEVDKQTFAPVRVSQTSASPKKAGGTLVRGKRTPLRFTGVDLRATEMRFESYERRPLDAQGRSLLVITPRGRTRTTTTTAAEQRERMRAKHAEMRSMRKP